MSHSIRRRTWLAASAGLLLTPHAAPALAQAPTSWAQTLAQARGQRVYFNAWGGSERTNAYLQWAAAQVKAQFGIELEHVKLTDTVEAVKRVRSEKAAGRTEGGSVDMLWINGENFLAMKREGLLFGPFAESLPNFAWVDVKGKPTTLHDFSEPTEGYEAAWGMAQLTFFADSARVATPPATALDWLAFAKAHPGRLTYPRPPAFHGTTFLKQALVERHADRAALLQRLYQPHTPEAFAQVAPALWQWLDQLHPHLWRQGQQFPNNAAAQRQLLADGELLIGITFNPNEAANEIAAQRLPATVVSWQPRGGSIGNTHFLAIPFNAKAKAGAQVVIDFLQSPVAQARKADISVWGDGTVLDVARLPAAARATFTAQRWPGQVTEPRATIPEPHGSWVDPLEREWLKRYGG